MEVRNCVKARRSFLDNLVGMISVQNRTSKEEPKT